MKFIINPSKLKLHHKKLISEEMLELLDRKNIKIVLDVFDSHEDRPDKNKPIIVLIHGNHASKEVFEDQVRNFSSTHRVISYDLLGHAQSTIISDLESLTPPEKELGKGKTQPSITPETKLTPFKLP